MAVIKGFSESSENTDCQSCFAASFQVTLSSSPDVVTEIGPVVTPEISALIGAAKIYPVEHMSRVLTTNKRIKPLVACKMGTLTLL